MTARPIHRAGLAAAILVIGAPVLAESDGAARIADLLKGEPDVRVIRSSGDEITFGVGDGQNPPGEILVSTRANPDTPSLATASFYISVNNHHPDPALSARVIQLADRIVAQDHGNLGLQRHPRESRQPPWPFLWSAALAALGALVVSRVRPVDCAWQVKLPHLLPAMIQTILLAYWTLYWRGFAELIPSILMQITLAYAIDAFIMLSRFGSWKITLAPVPIILSSMLFNWFDPVTTVIMIAAAICSRALIRREGRHIVNPSAFGLSVALLLTLLVPSWFIHGGPFVLFSLAPNLPELIVLLPLIPQLRFRIVLASLSAFLSIAVANHFYNHVPPLLEPGTLLMLTLFLTDPATMPRTPVGQILYGLSIGVSSAVVTWVAYALGAGDERLNKVVPVVIGNVMVPVFDAIGARARRWPLEYFEPRWNLAHVALWMLAVGALLGQGKAGIFNAARHWSNRTPLIVFDADGVPRCEHHPTFCRPFSFPSEAAGWVARLVDQRVATAGP